MKNILPYALLLGLAQVTLFEPKNAAGQEPGYRVWAFPTNLVVGEQFTAQWEVPPFSTTLDDWLGIYLHTGNTAIVWKFAAFRNLDTVFNAPEDPGIYELRYFEYEILSGSILSAISGPIVVLPSVDNPYNITNYPPKGKNIIAFGDSLVTGVGSTTGNDFPSLLAMHLGEPILNKGIIGDTTTNALLRIQHDVLDNDPKVVIVLLGANDVLKKVPPDVTEQSLRSIVRLIQARGAVVILVGVQGGIFTDRLRDIFHVVSTNTGVAFVPNILRGIIDNPFYLSDTLHPNNSGYAIISDRIFSTLQKLTLPNRFQVQIVRQMTNAFVRFPTQTNHIYNVFSREVLGTTNTVKILGPLIGTGGWVGVLVPTYKSQQFFFAIEQ